MFNVNLKPLKMQFSINPEFVVDHVRVLEKKITYYLDFSEVKKSI